MAQIILQVLLTHKIFRVQSIHPQNLLISQVKWILVSYSVQKNSCTDKQCDCAHDDDESSPVILYQVKFISTRNEYFLMLNLQLIFRCILIYFFIKNVVLPQRLLWVCSRSLNKIDPFVCSRISIVLNCHSKDNFLKLIIKLFSDRYKMGIKSLAPICDSWECYGRCLINWWL